MIPPTADIPGQFRPDGILAKLVQEVLDSTEPWSAGENPVETVRFDERVYPMAVDTTKRDVVWGVHRGHRARTPKLSPFVQHFSSLRQSLLGYITVELDGTPDGPVLTRVYGGEYTPPLPWMVSAKDAIGGRAACREFWRLHAYLDRKRTLIRPGTQTTAAPAWFCGD